MQTNFQIIELALLILLLLAIIIFKAGQSLGRVKMRREMQDAIEKSGVITADGCTFYRVQKIGWYESKSRAHHSPTDHSPKIAMENQSFNHSPTEE